jgi:transcriptional regulator with XRE-family HTH domain
MTEQELHVIFSSNIRENRNARHWSQSSLAKKTGVSVNFINDLETGKKWASPASMIKLANVFNIEVYELLRPSRLFPDNLDSIIKKYTENIHASLEETRLAFLQDGGLT